jgi:hypothetical protein
LGAERDEQICDVGVLMRKKDLEHEKSETRESIERFSFAVIAREAFRAFRDPTPSLPAKRPMQQRLKQMLRLPLLHTQALKLLNDVRGFFLKREPWSWNGNWMNNNDAASHTLFQRGTQSRTQAPRSKAGHLAAHRPKPERITRTGKAPLPPQYPKCGGTVMEETVRAQYQEDIPRPIETIATQFNVHIGHRADCATRVQGRHPKQTLDALGSAAAQLGPNVLALDAELKHDLGVSYGKVARIVRLTFGLDADASSFARAEQRMAQDLAPTYADLQTQLRPAVIIRKTNGCNRSPTEATVHAILASVIRTAHKHGHGFVDLPKRVLQQPWRIVVHLGNSASPPPLWQRQQLTLTLVPHQSHDGRWCCCVSDAVK